MQRIEELLGLQTTTLLTLPLNVKSSVQFHRNYQQRHLKLRLELIQISDEFGKVCYSTPTAFPSNLNLIIVSVETMHDGLLVLLCQPKIYCERYAVESVHYTRNLHS